MSALPVINSDPFASLWAMMHFPDDDELARAFVSLAQTVTIPIAKAEGYDWTSEHQREFFTNSKTGRPNLPEVQHRRYAGEAAGEIVRCLWALICERPEQASWDLAIRVAEAPAAERGVTAGRSSMRAHIGRFSPVLHFWGAWRIRGSEFKHDPGVDHPTPDDLDLFVMEAMSLRAGLREWATDRRSPDEKTIEEMVLEPWTGWAPLAWEAGSPEFGAIPKLQIATQVPWPKPPGRKRNPRPTQE